jgi:hypothetical protein
MGSASPVRHVERRCTYFCVDIECNGPVPGLYAMVSLGAVAVAPDADGHLQLGAQFYAELQPDAPRFDARAAAVHGLDQDRLRREGLGESDYTNELQQLTAAARRLCWAA